MWKAILYFIAAVLLAAVIAVVSLQSSTQWSVGEIVRTPDARFENLPDYDFAPHYQDSLGYRIHYVDEGPAQAPVILLLHGQPSWSYLYRHMIKPLQAAGFRVIAPDLVGFGKSDKPVEQDAYSYQMHVDVMTEFVKQLDLTNISYFGQDWGGLIGLRIVAEEPDRFDRIMISNTGLPAAKGIGAWIGYPLFRLAVWQHGDVQSPSTDGEDFSFTRWVAYARTVESFDYQGLFQASTTRELSDAELDAYAAPFPTVEHQAGAQIFPYLVPSQLSKNQQVMDEFYANWEKPFMTAFGDSDPVTAGGEAIWQTTVPGAANVKHVTVKNAAHFIQEDQSETLVKLLLAFISEH